MKRGCKFWPALLAIGLLAICGLSYGFAVGKMGFFLDDWYIIWTYRTFGVDKFTEFFRGDRPFFSLVYKVFIPLIKDSLLGWQLFAIFTKWLSALAFWVLLKLLLPDKKWLTYSVAALFAVYPGFKFHYFSVMYGQNYALFAIYFLSYIFMILGMRKPKKRPLFICLGLICQIIGIVPMELFFGLELVRPMVIFMETGTRTKQFKSRLTDTIKYWLPFFVILLGFTLFRTLFTHYFSYQFGFLDQLVTNTLATITTLIQRASQGLVDSLVNVWLDLIRVETILVGGSEMSERPLYFLASSILAALAISKCINWNTRESRPGLDSLWLAALGVYAVLAGMIPVLVAGLDVGLSFHTNRFLLPLSVGACLATVAWIDWIIDNKAIKSMLVILLVILSTRGNYLIGKEFQKAWDEQASFFAQLTWRAPQIKPETVLITPDLPFSLFFSGGSLTAPFNMIYAPDLHDNPVPFQIILAGSPQMDSMPELVAGNAIDRTSRVFRFIGNTSDMLVLYMPEKGCLQVVSPETDPASFQSDRYDSLWGDLIELSDLSRINTEAVSATLPPEFFNEVSTNQWCYFYQKASLAEQQGQWPMVIQQFELAEDSGLLPLNQSEWFPLIRAKIQMGELQEAIGISEKVKVYDQFTNQGLCSLWQDEELSPSPSEFGRIKTLLEKWDCSEIGETE